jgi:hypothetical protein
MGRDLWCGPPSGGVETEQARPDRTDRVRDVQCSAPLLQLGVPAVERAREEFVEAVRLVSGELRKEQVYVREARVATPERELVARSGSQAERDPRVIPFRQAERPEWRSRSYLRSKRFHDLNGLPDKVEL